MTAALLAGAVAGLGVAMPVGAITTLIALLSAQHGWRVGAAAGLGAATVDGLYATVALFFGALVAPLLVAWRTPLRWVAAGVLVVIAARLLRPAWRPSSAATSSAPPGTHGDERGRGGPPAHTAGAAPPAADPTPVPVPVPGPVSVPVPGPVSVPVPVPDPAQDPAPVQDAGAVPAPDPVPFPFREPVPAEAVAATRPRRAYLTFLGLTAVNPTTVVYFAALTTGGSAAGAVGPTGGGATFVVGAFAASAAWQLVIAGAGHGAGRVLTGSRGRRWTAIVGAGIVVMLAARTALGR